ncbi:hypothetical protein BDK88_2221 [Natrinema hispanicum]|uniref:Uncharacterized protein n=1 Tax=Natrinema hispanicum TaxID=392421 RepID=A0A482Y764_9EURY|nr:toxin transporter [Natrinema hispanicum]RZV10993.1 hypothetical protein BDK88_2221 [Natrinema hispanicum]
MKRALTLALTVALIGSLTFMGFAGTAAAASFENDAGVDQDTDAATDQAEELDQSNEQDAENDQEQEAEQENELDQGDNIALSGGGDAYAFNNADQKNNLYQKQKAKNYQKNDPKAVQYQDGDADADSVAVPITKITDFVNAAL